MDKNFFIQKIEQLTDDKLKELLQFRTKANAEIMSLAEHEAIKRGIDPSTIPKTTNRARPSQAKSNSEEEISWLRILGFFVS